METSREEWRRGRERSGEGEICEVRTEQKRGQKDSAEKKRRGEERRGHFSVSAKERETEKESESERVCERENESTHSLFFFVLCALILKSLPELFWRAAAQEVQI